MKKKTQKTIYWILTILFVLFMTMSGVSEIIGTEQGDQLFISLGYPLYLSVILGVAKLLGVVALLQPKFKTIKEWAYAGFTFDLSGAILSFIFIGAPIVATILPLLLLAVMFVSYTLWKKI